MFSLAKLREVLTFRRGALMAALLAVSAVAMASSDDHESSSGRVAKPVQAEGKGEKCVREVSYMRRNHMDELKHHRNATMRKGIRTTEFSLQGCINCHADKKTNSVLGKDGFCQGCHSYAAVKLDCFECHASKPKSATAFGNNLSQRKNSSGNVPDAVKNQEDTQVGAVEPYSSSGASK